jgi:hypothetical protein
LNTVESSALRSRRSASTEAVAWASAAGARPRLAISAKLNADEVLTSSS